MYCRGHTPPLPPKKSYIHLMIGACVLLGVCGFYYLAEGIKLDSRSIPLTSMHLQANGSFTTSSVLVDWANYDDLTPNVGFYRR